MAVAVLQLAIGRLPARCQRGERCLNFLEWYFEPAKNWPIEISFGRDGLVPGLFTAITRK
jgi:hypothetical protein